MAETKEAQLPLYEFQCPACEGTTKIRRDLAERDAPATCPSCSSDVSLVRKFPGLFSLRWKEGESGYITSLSPTDESIWPGARTRTPSYSTPRERRPGVEVVSDREDVPIELLSDRKGP